MICEKYSIYKIIRYSFLFIFAAFCIIMLAFSTMYACKEASELIYPDADNGFVWLTFESNISYGSDWDSFKAPLGIISIFQLVFGIVALCASIYNFLSNQKESLNRTIFIVGLSSMFLYALEGILYKNIYCDIMGYKTSFFATVSFIPFIIGAVMVIAYYLCLKLLPQNISLNENTEKETDNIANESSAISTIDSSSEFEKLELLAKYKELNSQGVLSDEEFDTKKKQLLGL